MLERKTLLAKLHCTRKELENQGFMDEEAYRGFLREVFGVDSAKNLNIEQLVGAIGRLTRTYKEPEAQQKKTPASKASRYVELCTDKQIAYLHHLWGRFARNRTVYALNGWLQHEFKTDKVEWLPKTKASKVIKVLEKLAEQGDRERAAELGLQYQDPSKPLYEGDDAA